MIGKDTVAIVGNLRGQKLTKEKKEVNIVEKEGIVRICVECVQGGGTDRSWTRKFTGVANTVPYEIRSHTELGGGKNALKEIRVYVRIHPTRTPADYEDVVFIVFGGGAEIGRFSFPNGGTLKYETDRYFEGNLTISMSNLPVSGEEVVYVDVVWRNLV